MRYNSHGRNLAPRADHERNQGRWTDNRRGKSDRATRREAGPDTRGPPQYLRQTHRRRLDAKNARRLTLIQSSTRRRFDTTEESELAILQPQVMGEITARHFRPRVFESDTRRMELCARQVLGDGDPLSPAEERELEQLQAALRVRYPAADYRSPFADPYLDAWLDETEARLKAEDRRNAGHGAGA